VTLVLGCDPGLSGALALLDEEASLLELAYMPTLIVTKSRRQIDASALVDTFEDWRAMRGEFRVVIEQASTRPMQHAAAGLKTGIGFGIILGILAAQKIPHEIVSPRKWQAAVLGKIEPGTSKDRSRAHAQQLYPHANLGKRKTEDRSDALCIALYGFERWRSR